MKQMSGGVTVDRGYRQITAGATPRAGSDVDRRARQSSPGAWDEDLGRWGSDEWNLAGMGESGPGCGEWYPEAVCETCGEPTFATRSCGRRSCPECWGMWAKQAAVRATRRVQAFRYTQPDDYRRQTAHAVVSPPEEAVMNKREFFDGRAQAAEIAEEKGFRGFAVVPHPYRVTEAGKDRYRAEVDGAAEPGREAEYGLWVWLRKDVENWRELVYWSPHYHIIGLTSRDMTEGQEGDEWAYHFIRSFESFESIHDRESHEDLYGAFRYLLSHTGFPSGSTKQVTTWYGSLANSVFVEDATESYQHEKPSEGILSALEREIEAVAGVEVDDDSESESVPTDDMGECPIEDCEGVLIDVFDVSAYLRQAQPPPDVRDRMIAARDWRLGEIVPPPGMKRPTTEEQAREAFEALL